MLIRSQDKTHLFYFESPMELSIVELPKVIAEHEENSYIITCWHNKLDSFGIASYSSKEKAIKVLDKIQGKYISSFMDRNKDKPCFYQMPQDEEVKLCTYEF